MRYEEISECVDVLGESGEGGSNVEGEQASRRIFTGKQHS